MCSAASASGTMRDLSGSFAVPNPPSLPTFWTAFWSPNVAS